MKTPKTKTAALLEAKNALKDYLKKHKLNPMKDYREDPVHGKEVTRLVNRLNIERDKVLDKYPYNDITNETKLVKMKEKKLKAKKEEKAEKKTSKTDAPAAEAPKKEKKAKKAEKAAVPEKPLKDKKKVKKVKDED